MQERRSERKRKREREHKKATTNTEIPYVIGLPVLLKVAMFEFIYNTFSVCLLLYVILCFFFKMIVAIHPIDIHMYLFTDVLTSLFG